MNPTFVNPAAAQILVYPQKLDSDDNVDAYLAGRIRSALILQRPSNGTPVVSHFQSGRRHYICRTFRVSGIATADPQPSFAVILERASTKPDYLTQLQEKFHLTAREREVALFLLQGLKSKEIGIRMQISPNTVKAFLRLIMVKMGVTTRSGIVGKAFSVSHGLDDSGTPHAVSASALKSNA